MAGLTVGVLKRLLFGLAALLSLVQPAHAITPHQRALILLNSPVTAAYVGPGDAVGSATAFWGLRAYNAAIVTAGTQALVNLRRASDGHTCDIKVSAAGGLGNTANCSTSGENGTAVASWCASTSCFAATFYDQTGNSNDLTQATTANQPLLVFNCLGSLPCLRGNGTSQQMSKSSVALLSPLSASGVIKPSGSTLGIPFSNLEAAASAFTGNYLSWNVSPNTISGTTANNNVFATGSTTAGTLAAGSAGSIGATWTSSTSRTGYLNGTAATADTSSSNPTTQNRLSLFAAVKNTVSNWYTGDIFEFGVWNSALSGANHSALCHNQFGYWGTAVSC